MKVLMVPVADRPECRVALEQAFRLAGELTANVVGYHLRPHREEPTLVDGTRFAEMLEGVGLPEYPESELRLNSQHAQQLFRAIAEDHEVPIASKPRSADHPLAFWNEMVGTPEKLFGIIGPTADCILVSRPKPKGHGAAQAFLLAALLRSGRPLLVLPQRSRKRVGKRILIAWNQGTQVAAAVTAALPLLLRAKQVHIVCCGKEEAPGPKLKHVRNYLAHHGIEAHAHRRGGRDVCGEILSAYRKTNSDLLIMGAYSRSHLRQRILGGVTHDLLLHGDLPVYALHG